MVVGGERLDVVLRQETYNSRSYIDIDPI